MPKARMARTAQRRPVILQLRSMREADAAARPVYRGCGRRTPQRDVPTLGLGFFGTLKRGIEWRRGRWWGRRWRGGIHNRNEGRVGYGHDGVRLEFRWRDSEIHDGD